MKKIILTAFLTLASLSSLASGVDYPTSFRFEEKLQNKNYNISGRVLNVDEYCVSDISLEDIICERSHDYNGGVGYCSVESSIKSVHEESTEKTVTLDILAMAKYSSSFLGVGYLYNISQSFRNIKRADIRLKEMVKDLIENNLCE